MPMHQPPAPTSPNSSRRSGKNGVDCVTRHPKYYMVGGDLPVLIDDVMFKVHSFFFKRESGNFFDDAPPESSPEPSSPEIEDRGSSESGAIRIPHVSVKEFEQFLWVFYNPKYDIYEADVYSWFSILKLAHRWDFPNVKDFALRELKRREPEIPLVERICLYQDHEAPLELLVPLFAELCARESGLSDEEMIDLGYEQSCYVWRTRGALRSPEGVSSLPEGVTQAEVYAVVSQVMGLPVLAPGSEVPKEPSGVQPGAPSEDDVPQSEEGKSEVGTTPKNRSGNKNKNKNKRNGR